MLLSRTRPGRKEKMQTRQSFYGLYYLSVADASGSYRINAKQKSKRGNHFPYCIICPSLAFPARKTLENAKSVGARVVGDGDRSLTLRAGSVSDGQNKLRTKIWQYPGVTKTNASVAGASGKKRKNANEAIIFRGALFVRHWYITSATISLTLPARTE